LSTKLLGKKTYNFLKLTSQNSQNYYPEILGNLYIINSGLLFKTAWAVCKAFLDEKTKKKITTLGTDYKKHLLEFVEPQNLPRIFGGECDCEPFGCVYSDCGPWNKEGKADVDENFLKNKELLSPTKNDSRPEHEVEDNIDFRDDDSDDEDRNKLAAELSKQLNENMGLSKGQKENAKHKFEDGKDIDDGETPINTQENGEYDTNN